MLNKNEGLRSIKRVYNVLKEKPNDQEEESDDLFHNYAPTDYESLEFAPLVSCDVERIFSQYKTVLADNRRRFTVEHLK